MRLNSLETDSLVSVRGRVTKKQLNQFPVASHSDQGSGGRNIREKERVSNQRAKNENSRCSN
jgi:hypothetical protein